MSISVVHMSGNSARIIGAEPKSATVASLLHEDIYDEDEWSVALLSQRVQGEGGTNKFFE